MINCTSVFLNFIKSYKNMRLVFKGFLDSLKEKKSAFSWSSGYSGLDIQPHIEGAGLAVREC